VLLLLFNSSTVTLKLATLKESCCLVWYYRCRDFYILISFNLW